MNFKINNIEKDIECRTPVFEELNLLCGKTMIDGKEKVLINATKYCDSIGTTFNVCQFMQLNSRQINILVKDNKIDCNNLFFSSNTGVAYMAVEMSILFLSAVDATLYTYFNEMIFDMLYKGIAISDKKIMELVMDRVPNETLEKIIESRNEEKQ